jgi:23S rRNA (guanosine2251-2'-O)-methyltransferase
VDVRSTHNVGSAFRTADSIGVEHVYLVGYTPAPVDRFGRERSDIAKTALGAEKTIPWSQHENAIDLIKELKEKGVQCIAVEQDVVSVDYKKVELQKPVAFVFGNEVDGISKDVLKEVDVIAEIPQRGEKESLNVSVSIGVVLYRLLDTD